MKHRHLFKAYSSYFKTLQADEFLNEMHEPYVTIVLVPCKSVFTCTGGATKIIHMWAHDVLNKTRGPIVCVQPKPQNIKLSNQ